nr:hypothetical protein CFP56_64161 [Quercus suber]
MVFPPSSSRSNRHHYPSLLSTMILHLNLCLLLGGLVAATQTGLQCSTAYGSSSVAHISRTTLTSTTTCKATVTKTKTPKTTVHPATHTTTIVQRATTTKSASSVVTVTSTTYTSTTTTVEDEYPTFTQTDSIIYTSTIAPTTTTIAPSADFTPLQAEISAMGDTAQKRDFANEGPLILPRTAASKSYPTAVICTTTVDVPHTRTITKTAKTTSTVTATTPQTTTFITRTPSAASTTTTTISAIRTTTTTYTFASTSTVQIHSSTTVHAAVATFYAACSANNLLRRVNGIGLPDAFRPFDSSTSQHVLVATPYDCCVAAIQGNHAGAVFGTDPAGSPQTNCEVFFNTNRNPAGAGTTCAFNGTRLPFQTIADSDARTVASNGNCGNFVYSGVFAFDPPPTRA